MHTVYSHRVFFHVAWSSRMMLSVCLLTMGPFTHGLNSMPCVKDLKNVSLDRAPPILKAGLFKILQNFASFVDETCRFILRLTAESKVSRSIFSAWSLSMDWHHHTLVKWAIPPRLCQYIIGHTRLHGPTQLCLHTFVPTLVCAQTWLCPDTFDLCPDMIVPRHVCAQTH